MTAANYGWVDPRASNGAFGTDGVNVDTSIRLATNIGNASNERWQGSIFVDLPHEVDQFTGLRSVPVKVNNGGFFNTHFSGGMYRVAGAVDSIRLFASTGNLTAKLWIFALTP